MYAEGTTVSPEKSRAEIERLVRQHRAIKVGSFSDQEQAVVTFATADRMVKFSVPMPSPKDAAIIKTAKGRRRWRCLLLAIKAKLESVESRIETFDEAFLAHIVTPGGRTILEEIRAIEKGGGQRLLGAAD